jgi:hypothetical protein
VAPAPAPAPPAAAPPIAVPPAAPEALPADAWLAGLVEAAAEGQRRDDIGGDEFWRRLDELRAEQRELLAIQWLEKFLAAPATPAPAATGLRARLVQWLLDRGSSGEAVPHLEKLAEDEAHAARAHHALAEHYRRAGDEVQALRHYEAVLARQVDFPNVRARVERIRAARGRGVAPALGDTIAGPGAGADGFGAASGARYRLVRELGRGATGVVYLARDAQLERDVAVKLLHPHLAAARQAESCARVFDEARVAASLRHPNNVALLDLDEGARRIVMELAAGGTLRDLLRDHGPRPVRAALERHAQLLSAVAAAHRRGIVHRDIKPGNLLFRRNPDEPGVEIVLGDFGIAHLPDADVERRADAAGTLAYMAPEQRRGEPVPRSDVYAAAVVLFEMLTGRAPWTRAVLLTGQRTREDFMLARTLSKDWPDDLATGLQDHLLRLGDPSVDTRPDVAHALAEANRLRDLAVAHFAMR